MTAAYSSKSSSSDSKDHNHIYDLFIKSCHVSPDTHKLSLLDTL
jgi:hypothetical protein